MRLFIAEKPELARAIVEGLGQEKRCKGYIECNGGKDVVTWCFGHLMSLTDPEDHDEKNRVWDLCTLPLVWPISFKPLKGKEQQLKIIISLIKKADSIVHAGDVDSEGQLLVDEILSYAKNTKPVKRLLINDYNKEIVKRSLSSMKDNSEYRPLLMSALARSVADQRLGYNLTRAYTLTAGIKNTVFSVGRVQTPILGMIVRRERENLNHVPKPYFRLDVRAHLNDTENCSFKCIFVYPEGAPLDENGNCLNKSYLEQIKKEIETKRIGIVEEIEKTSSSNPPPLPFSLLKLQVMANKLFNYSADSVLEVTQNLREKYKLITYNRSDCQYLSEEQHGDSEKVLKAIRSNEEMLLNAVKVTNKEIKSKAFNSGKVTAHHAIIPTEAIVDFSNLTKEERNIYFLIARQYIAQFMQNSLYNKVIVTFRFGDFLLKSSFSECVRKGWENLFFERKTSSKDNITFEQSLLRKDSVVKLDKISVIDCFSKPAPLYTIASLLEDLTRVARYIEDPSLREIMTRKDKGNDGENGGIGTPATRSVIIKSLFSRGFVKEKNKKITATELGNLFYDKLPKSVTSIDMTAKWQEQLEKIEEGKEDIKNYLNSVNVFIYNEVEEAKKHYVSPEKEKSTIAKKQNIKSDSNSEFVCIECGRNLVRRKSKNGKGYWWGCSGFPKCKCTYRDFKKNPVFDIN